MADLHKLLEDLVSENSGKSRKARDQLSLESNSIANALINAITSEHPGARMEVLNFLEFLPDLGLHHAIDELLRKETNPEVREQAIRTMRSFGYCPESLLSISQDKNDPLQAEALEALGYSFNLAGIVNALENSLSDDDMGIRKSAAYNLEYINDAEYKFPKLKSALDQIKRDFEEEEYWEEFYCIENYVENSFPDKKNAISHRELRDLFSTILKQSQNGQDDDSVSLLIRNLEREDPSLRLAALYKLSQMYPDFDLDEGEEIVTAFIHMLSDQEDVIKRQAIDALFQTGSERINEALLPLLDSSNEDIRMEVKWVLEQHGE